MRHHPAPRPAPPKQPYSTQGSDLVNPTHRATDPTVNCQPQALAAHAVSVGSSMEAIQAAVADDPFALARLLSPHCVLGQRLGSGAAALADGATLRTVLPLGTPGARLTVRNGPSLGVGARRKGDVAERKVPTNLASSAPLDGRSSCLLLPAPAVPLLIHLMTSLMPLPLI